MMRSSAPRRMVLISSSESGETPLESRLTGTPSALCAPWRQYRSVSSGHRRPPYFQKRDVCGLRQIQCLLITKEPIDKGVESLDTRLREPPDTFFVLTHRVKRHRTAVTVEEATEFAIRVFTG